MVERLGQLAIRVKQDVRSLVTTVIAFVILYAFGVIDEMLRWALVRSLTEHLETRVKILALSVYAASNRVDVDEFAVSNWVCFASKHEAVSVFSGRLEVDVVCALRTRTVALDGARFRRVRVCLSRHRDGSLNFEFFAKHKRAKYDLSAEDGWVQVVPADLAEDYVAEKWTWTRALFREAAQRASDAEHRLRSQNKRSLLEDAALKAFQAKTAAKEWASDKLKDGLTDVLKRAYERADKNLPNRKNWTLRFNTRASVVVDEFQLELYGADGDAMIDQPLVFGSRSLDDLDTKTHHCDGTPARVLLKLGFLLVESCVHELVKSRPDDAASLAKALAKQVANDTRAKTRDLQKRATNWLLNDSSSSNDEQSPTLPRLGSLSDLTTPIVDLDT